MRKIFIVPAGSSRHFLDTIGQRRSIDEVRGFIEPEDISALSNLYHGKGFIVWGARNTEGNRRQFMKMSKGDYVLMTLNGKVVLIAEVSFKLNSPQLAKYFWRTNEAGETWENIYFLINEKTVEIPLEELNKYIGYSLGFRPQGLMAIDTKKQEDFESQYGEIYDLVLSLDKGREIKEKEHRKIEVESAPKEEPEKFSEHTEIQWRLIRLGQESGSDIWLPRNDQNKSFEGNKFKDFLLEDFQEGVDVPTYVKNLDTVWKYGYQIKSVFEIEHSTSIYSGLLRMSDLKAITPNTVYPMFIVAPRDRKPNVFEQLERPTFKFFNMDKDVAFLSYDIIRELDDKFSGKNLGFTEEILSKAAERI
jgi:hypothetical protein